MGNTSMKKVIDVYETKFFAVSLLKYMHRRCSSDFISMYLKDICIHVSCIPNYIFLLVLQKNITDGCQVNE